MSTLGQAFGKYGNRAVDGVWFDGPEGTRFKIAMMSNDAYLRRLARLRDQNANRAGFRRVKRNTDKAIDEDIRIVRRAAAEMLLLDWDGVTGDDDRPLAYTPDQGEQAFADSPIFYNWVLECASDVARFDEVEQREQEKNSSNVLSETSEPVALPARKKAS